MDRQCRRLGSGLQASSSGGKLLRKLSIRPALNTNKSFNYMHHVIDESNRCMFTKSSVMKCTWILLVISIPLYLPLWSSGYMQYIPKSCLGKPQPIWFLQLGQNSVSARNLTNISKQVTSAPHSNQNTYRNLTGALLVLSIHYLAMVEHHSPATVTVTHTRLPPMVLAKKSLCVAQEEDLVALDAVDLAPCIHHPGIVARNRGNDVDALCLELCRFGNVRRQVVCLATWSEGAGHGEDDDFLVGPFFAGVVLLRAAASSGVGVGNGRPSTGGGEGCG